jgi:hypothetical protein
MSLMPSDYYEPSSRFKKPNHHSSLFTPMFDSNVSSLESSVQFWTSNGFPKEKILLGLTLFARMYKSSYTGSDSLDVSSIDMKVDDYIEDYYKMNDGVLSYQQVIILHFALNNFILFYE